MHGTLRVKTGYKKYNCINDLMLMLCHQSATLLKTRLPHRRFLVFLDFTKNSAIKKHKCINDLMLLLCHQSVTYQK